MSENEDEAPTGTAVEQISEGILAISTGLPPQVQKSFFKAIGRIAISAAEWPAAYFEGRGRIIKATSEAEAAAIKARQKALEAFYKEGTKSAGALFKDPDKAQRAFDNLVKETFEEQVIKEDIVTIAAEQLRISPPASDTLEQIDDDILREILKQGCKRSTEEFKTLFGKILAGEIKRPGAFSMKTIQSLSQMNSRTAYIFQLACNISSSGIIDPKIIQDPFGEASNNALDQFGLSYSQLMVLVEDGLLRPSFSEWQDMLVYTKLVTLPFEHGNETMSFTPIMQVDENTDYLSLRVSGPAFTKVGTELRQIVDIKRNDKYFDGLNAWFGSRGYSFLPSPKI
jgi:hypothetical protein